VIRVGKGVLGLVAASDAAKPNSRGEMKKLLGGRPRSFKGQYLCWLRFKKHARQDSNLQPSVPKFMQQVRNGNAQDLNLTFGSQSERMYIRTLLCWSYLALSVGPWLMNKLHRRNRWLVRDALNQTRLIRSVALHDGNVIEVDSLTWSDYWEGSDSLGRELEELGKGILEAEKLFKARDKQAAYGKIDEMIAIARDVLPIP